VKIGRKHVQELRLRSFFYGPEWPEVSLPDWFKERATALIAALGPDKGESKLFQAILDANSFKLEMVQPLDDLIGFSQNTDAVQLATDISVHAFTTVSIIGQVVPARPVAPT
jgi:hypothetical protein